MADGPRLDVRTVSDVLADARRSRRAHRHRRPRRLVDRGRDDDAPRSRRHRSQHPRRQGTHRRHGDLPVHRRRRMDGRARPPRRHGVAQAELRGSGVRPHRSPRRHGRDGQGRPPPRPLRRQEGPRSRPSGRRDPAPSPGSRRALHRSRRHHVRPAPRPEHRQLAVVDGIPGLAALALLRGGADRVPCPAARLPTEDRVPGVATSCSRVESTRT